ncbi:MAG: TRC40/GET3/ArsA family transport-energizing ATPase [Acidobacteria bacterium]|nr:TRC40/GET3/ArsA family transport-energizing ATPase [Acidobacteriota bacterium]
MTREGSAGRKGAPTRRPPKPAARARSKARTTSPAPKTARKTSKTSKTAQSPSRTPKAAHTPPHPAKLELPADFPGTRYLFFGGKGGVGKTTTAASAALLLLDTAAEGERILLFSTDPAHSLSDSLGVEVGDRLVEVARRGRGAAAPRLFAREMDATRALEEFKTKHRAVLAEIADRGTMLDEADINDLLGLSLPGMDEVMSLFELSEVDRAGTFARVVVDTAPSGHTSRMLRLPEVFARWIKALDQMSEKHRYLIAQFARGGRGGRVADEVELFLREMDERVRAVRAMLFDPARASFTLVTIPEAMAFEESVRYRRTLGEAGVSVTDLVINRVEQARGSCPFCRARARMQTQWLKRLDKEFKDLRARRVPVFPTEVSGPEDLRRFAREVWNSRSRRNAEVRTLNDELEEKADAIRSSLSVLTSDFPPRSGFRLDARQLLVFGGKGGVGKTTAAAAAALRLAETDKKARVLVFSTDPAHSLSDSFGETVGELRRGVAGLKNLDAKEIDPAARFEELKERYRAWTDELFESLTGGSRWEIQFDREAMRELVALAPPGIDEIAALATISDLLEEGTYTSIVLDTAPTGHLLRFLELPQVALSWVRTFIKLLLKYKNVVRWGGVAEELVALSKSIKRVAALLSDARHSEFVGVAIPERMSLEETARMTASLKRLDIPLSRLLINNVVTKEAARACDFCAARRRAQGEVLDEFRRRFARGFEIFVAPQQPGEVNGRERLREHFRNWRPVRSSGRHAGASGPSQR